MSDQPNTNNQPGVNPPQVFNDAPPPPPIISSGVTTAPPDDNKKPKKENIVATDVAPPIPGGGGGGPNVTPGDEVQPQADIPPVVTAGGGHFSGGFGKKRIATILGLLLLVGGISTGVYLVQQNQNIRERAQVACTGCTITNDDGTETCITDTNNFQCGTGGDRCQACQSGTTCTNGICVEEQAATPQVQCLAVRAYSVNEEDGSFPTDETQWTELTQNDLSALSPGDIVFFTITGRADDPTNFSMARFKVNDEETQESSLRKPIPSDEKESDGMTPRAMHERDFYYRYVVPTGVTQFTVEAAIKYGEDWVGSVE